MWWRRRDEDFAEEIRSHLELETDRLVSDGMSPAEARVTARRRFGNVTTHKERFYESLHSMWWDQIRQDVRYAARSLLKTPGFAGVAVLTLALGLGANMAVFSVVHAVLLSAFAYPVDEPDRVLWIAEQSPQGGQMGVSYPTFRDWVEQLESFEILSGYRETTYTLTGNHEPLRVRALQTSFTYFGLQGIQPLHGRVYDANDDRVGAARVVVLNHQLWQERFGARPDVLGDTVLLNGNAHTVIGVLPSGIDLIEVIRVYTPLESWAGSDSGARFRGNHSALYVHGRLGPGVTFEQARAELTATATRFETAYPDTNSGVGVMVHRLPEWRLRNYRTILLVLQAAVVILWLIACTNVANLMLARAMTRRRQYAISSALGAGPLRTVRQLLVENLLLSLTAAGLGLIIAIGAVQVLRTATPFDIPRLAQAQLNWPVVAFGGGLAILAGLVAGLLPGALVARRLDVTTVLNEDGANARGGGGGRRLHRGLLVTEMALATLLLLGAGALIRTIAQLTRVDPGFHNEQILTARLLLVDAELDSRGIEAVFRDLRRRVDALPEVVSSGLAQSLPLLGSNWTSVFMVADQPVPARADLPTSAFNPAVAGYFDTMGIPLLEGRHITDTDQRESPPIVVVTEMLARRLWPTESAIGKRLKQGWPESEGDSFPWREIVGVVGNIRQDGLDTEPRSETFIPFGQDTPGFMALVIRTTGEPMRVVEPVRAAIRAAHPDLLAYDVRSMDDILSTAMAPRQFVMWALSMFGLIAMLIAAVGIYGILAHSVAQRSHELGVRMALGADRRDLGALIVRESVVTAMAGVVLGAAGSIALMGLVEIMILPQTAADPWLWMLVPLFVVTIAVLAEVVPASRAARIDPVVSLRGV